MGWFSSSLFRRKDVGQLIDEMNSGDRLQRRLGPMALMGLGIGATIGTGLYVQTGFVAREFAGPSLVLSFLLAAIGCGFAAVCYSELASMVPVAGSAYTYAYATLGELLAWVIGWDLILEYAIGSSVVAAGWSNYLDSFLRHVFHVAIDPRLTSAPWDFAMNEFFTRPSGTAVAAVPVVGAFDFEIKHGGFFLQRVALADGRMVQAWFNLPAVFVTAMVTVVLVVGIKESAIFNAAMVVLNIAVILTVIGIGAAYVEPRNWHPFLHEKEGWHGVGAGAGRIFFAYIGFDSISTHAEEARRPRRDLAIGIMGALTVCTVLYVAVAAVLTGMVPYREIDIQAPLAAALHSQGLTFAGGLITLGILAGMTSSLLVGNLSQPRILLAMARDGLLPRGLFAAVHPRFKTPWKSTILVGVVVAAGAALAPLGFLADLVSIGTLFAFVVVSAAVWVLRITDPDMPRPFRAPMVPVVCSLGVLVNGGMMFFLGPENWLRLLVWLVLGLVIYFGYSRRHSVLRAGRSSRAAHRETALARGGHMAANDRGPRWYQGQSAAQWIILAVASAGWVFDVYEGQLFTIFKTPMLAELTGGDKGSIDWQANIGFAAFLFGGAAGGLFFGVLGDRYGRVRALSATILVYSGFSALTALVHSLWQVHLLRFLVALGTGGEWAIAAALVAETFPPRSRASASGLFHASSVIGVALASLTGMVFDRPELWRWAFLVGLAPALLVLWIRLGLREPQPWTAELGAEDAIAGPDPMPAPTGAPSKSARLSELFGRRPWRSRAVVGIGLATVGLATYWGIFAWAPELVRLVLADSTTPRASQSASSLVYLLMNFTGGLLGLLSFAPLASWRGRRFAFAVYHAGAAILAPLTFLGARSYPQALCLLPVMAFFVLGMHAGYAIYFPELFPTRLRATGSSACFNLGRVLGAVILLVRGSLGSMLGLRWAVVAISSLFLAGLVILIFAPETRGLKLPE